MRTSGRTERKSRKNLTSRLAYKPACLQLEDRNAPNDLFGLGSLLPAPSQNWLAADSAIAGGLWDSARPQGATKALPRWTSAYTQSPPSPVPSSTMAVSWSTGNPNSPASFVTQVAAGPEGRYDAAALASFAHGAGVSRDGLDNLLRDDLDLLFSGLQASPPQTQRPLSRVDSGNVATTGTPGISAAPSASVPAPHSPGVFPLLQPEPGIPANDPAGSPGVVPPFRPEPGNPANDPAGIRFLSHNLPPDAVVDAAITTEETAVTINVLANDTDPESDPLTVTEVSQGSGGWVDINPDQTVTYTPNGNNVNPGKGFYGMGGFSYKITDGQGNSDETYVYVIVEPVDNHGPVANDDTYQTNPGTTLTVPGPGVLGNDSDANGDQLMWQILEDTSNGSLAIGPANGAFTYTPYPGFVGTDVFLYQADDGAVASNIGVVAIGVGEQAQVKSALEPKTIRDANNNPVGVLEVFVIRGDIVATFESSVPANNPTPAEAARRLGFHHFNFYQVVTADNRPPVRSDNMTRLVPPYVDPASGGWGNDPDTPANDTKWADNLPWYLDEGPGKPPQGVPRVTGHVDQSVKGENVLYHDRPNHPTGNTTRSFKTWLVGLDNKAALKSWIQGFSWDWTKDAQGRISITNVRWLMGNPQQAEYTNIIGDFKNSL